MTSLKHGDKAIPFSLTGVDDVTRYENPDAVGSHYLRDALDAVLAGQTPSTTETAPVGCTIKWK